MKHWLLRVLVAANQMANATIGGDPQMSLSARAGFAREHGSHLAKVWCRAFDIPDIHHEDARYPHGADHCQIAMIDYFRRKGTLNP